VHQPDPEQDARNAREEIRERNIIATKNIQEAPARVALAPQLNSAIDRVFKEEYRETARRIFNGNGIRTRDILPFSTDRCSAPLDGELQQRICDFLNRLLKKVQGEFKIIDDTLLNVQRNFLALVTPSGGRQTRKHSVRSSSKRFTMRRTY